MTSAGVRDLAAELPKKFTLPGGYIIRIKYVAFDWLQAFAKAETVDVQPDDKVYAFYEDKGGAGVMYLVRGRHPLLLATDFVHEIKHAWAEWEDWYLGEAGVTEVIEKAAEPVVE